MSRMEPTAWSNECGEWSFAGPEGPDWFALYTADQIREMVETVRAEFDAKLCEYADVHVVCDALPAKLDTP